MEHSSTSPDSQARQDAAGASSGEPSVAGAPEDAVEHSSTNPESQAARNPGERGGDVRITVGDLGNGFYVADDGQGIPEADRSRVFDTGYTTREDGTGFGLAIVKEVVDAHDWEIRVTDPADGGARFEITGVEFDR